MTFQPACKEDFPAVQAFYWDVTDSIRQNNKTHANLGWEKGVYPSDAFLQSSIEASQLYLLKDGGTLCACAVLNSACNEGYAGCPWSTSCAPDQLLIPHALAVHPSMQGKGIGKALVEQILTLARAQGKRAVRLDVLGAYPPARHLYLSCGFQFVAARKLFYEDTGWTEYLMFERNL